MDTNKKTFLGYASINSILQTYYFVNFCKEEEHSSHQNECIRFEVLNQSIVDIHNILLQECQKQIAVCFRNLLDSNFAKKMEECQLLHKILQSKKYEEAKANINMIQKYQYFDQDKLKQYIHQIQCISEKLMNQFNQISIIDQNDRIINHILLRKAITILKVSKKINSK